MRRAADVLQPAADSWALVTGATSGIGAAYARDLARRGFRLMLTGRREAELRAVAQGIGADRTEVHLLELSDPECVEALLRSCQGKRIDVLVNNAGFGTGTFYLEGPFDAEARMERVHVAVPMRLIYALAPAMVARGGGAVVNVSSLASFMPLPGSASYSGTKTFLRVFSESLAMELAGTGVRVQALCPGFTRTHFHAALGMPDSLLRNRFIVRWMAPEAVVRASMRSLAADGVVCVPGFWNRVLRRAVALVPRRVLASIVTKTSRRGPRTDTWSDAR